jgi:hypothetical protein
VKVGNQELSPSIVAGKKLERDRRWQECVYGEYTGDMKDDSFFLRHGS